MASNFTQGSVKLGEISMMTICTMRDSYRGFQCKVKLSIKPASFYGVGFSIEQIIVSTEPLIVLLASFRVLWFLKR